MNRKRNKIIESSFDLQISQDINETITKLKDDFGQSSDFVVSYYKSDQNIDLVCAIVYIKSLVDMSAIGRFSMELTKLLYDSGTGKTGMDFEALKCCFSGVRDSKEAFDYETLYADLLLGYAVFLMEGYNKYFTIVTNTNEGRAIEEPTSQTIIRGPKEGFTERVYSNILLIRKRIKNKALKVENLSIGSVTRTTVTLVHIDKVAKNEIVQEIRSRLSKIEINGILDSGYIEELIKDDRYSIFPTFLNSEKPDSVVAALLEGKVAILVDGSPFVITAPALMIEFFQVSEDYYHHFILSSLVRIIRFTSFLLTLFVPAIFLATITFHQEMIPTPLLISIAAQREGVPISGLIESIVMGFTFEVISEAGIRMPRVIGPAISIVGALVLGQAAVEAGIISASMVIVVSITAISNFAIPNYEMSNAVRIIRFALVLLAGVLGLYGIFMGIIALVLHLSKLKSIGVPYLTPAAPIIIGDNKDTILRFPLWKMKYGPRGTSGTAKKRVDDENLQSPGQKEKQELG